MEGPFFHAISPNQTKLTERIKMVGREEDSNRNCCSQRQVHCTLMLGAMYVVSGYELD